MAVEKPGKLGEFFSPTLWPPRYSQNLLNWKLLIINNSQRTWSLAWWVLKATESLRRYHTPLNNLIKYFINPWGVFLLAVVEQFCTVCPLWIYTFVQIHQDCILGFELSIKYTLHVTVCTWLQYNTITVILTQNHTKCTMLCSSTARTCSSVGKTCLFQFWLDSLTDITNTSRRYSLNRNQDCVWTCVAWASPMPYNHCHHKQRHSNRVGRVDKVQGGPRVQGVPRVPDKIHCITVVNFMFNVQWNSWTSMKISGGSPLKGMGGEWKERRGTHLDILSRAPQVPSYTNGHKVTENERSTVIHKQ